MPGRCAPPATTSRGWAPAGDPALPAQDRGVDYFGRPGQPNDEGGSMGHFDVHDDPGVDLFQRPAEGRGELLLFAVTPPRREATTERAQQVADVTLERLRPLGLDGLVLYDIDDESDRTAAERPFPFLPTMDPADYLARDLAALDVPAVVYR